MVERNRNFSTLQALLVGLILTLLGSLAFAAGSAHAEPEGARIIKFSVTPSDTQAGGHPDLTVDFKVGTRVDPLIPNSCNCNQIKNALVETPAGFIGAPSRMPRCTVAEFGLDRCPVDSQVGIAKPTILFNDGLSTIAIDAPLYNLTPAPGQAALLGFKAFIFNFPIYTVIKARTGGDYGLDAEVKGITQFFALQAFYQKLWGVPASPEHDGERYKSGGGAPELGGTSNSPEKPFLSAPTSCVGPQISRFTTTAYDHGVHTGTAPWPATTGCDQLDFNPSLSASPSTTAADSASGLDVVLKVPQNESPTTPSDSEIKATTVTLPEGFSINPSAADGKTSCSDVQARFGTEEEAQCPENSKVGTLSLLSSALPEAITGAIYLGEPQPGNRYRIFITADGFGTHVKLPGSAYPDPNTGQLTVSFQNLPQAPLTEFNMHFFGSERGLLATPGRCGTYAVNSEFVPWDAELPNQASTQFFAIDSGPGGAACPAAQRPFKPGFRATGASNGAGSHSPFSVYITRPDGDQTLSTIGVNTPPGFTATLKGIPKCSEQALRETESPTWSGVAELANSKCPPASQVGLSSAGAGAGSKPYYAPGKVYLTGPYKDAPLSFTVVTPAVSGPYDLGNVVNRVAVNVDPATAAVTATSDPLPQIIGGIPLRLRSVLINLDRKNFTLNPTNCDPFEVTGILTGDQGAKASPQSHFQVANCETLDFEPKLKTVLKGSTKRGGYPALTATLTQSPAGESNTARAAVALPHSEFLAQEHIRTICTRVQYAADNCPAGSIYGQAKAVTPLLDEPVSGPVYLRASSNPLPDLVAALRGPASMPIEVDLVGKIDSVKGGIRTTFAAIPDTPVSKFVLSMRGGQKGLLKNSRNLCKAPSRVDARITGQSGATANQRPALEAPCRKARKKAKAKKRAAAMAKRTATDNRRAGR
jgi:hypothetical protein